MSGETPIRSPTTRMVSALTLHFAAVAGIVLCRTQIDLVFLSTYPRSYLPYLFVGQTVAVMTLTFATKGLIARGRASINATLLVLVTGLAFAGQQLVFREIPFAPFALCLVFAAQAFLLGVLSWSTVGDAFDMRSFKRAAKWVNVSGNVGALLVGSAIPLFIQLFSADALLVLLAGLIAISAVMLFLLKPLGGGGAGAAKQSSRSPLSYPLFRALAMGAGLMILVDTLIDYAMKAELAAAFTKEQIGAFMGPFYGVSSALTLLVQLAASGALLKSFGLTGLLAPMPLFCLLAAGAMAASPGLWTAAILRLGENIAGYSVNNIGRAVALQPLPGAIRRSGKLYLKGVANPLGTALSAGILWIAAEQIGLRGVAIAAAVCSAAWLLVSWKTARSYQGALEEAVGAGRLLGTVDEIGAESLQASRSVAEHALASDDPSTVLFGLELLQKVGHGALPERLRHHLQSQTADVRAAAARAISAFEEGSAASTLLASRLEAEQDPEVMWRLLEGLAALKADDVIERCAMLVDSPHAQVRGGAVLVLLVAGDLDGIIKAALTLRQMINHDDSAMRKAAARAIGALRAGKLESELRTLVADADQDVCITAIRAAGDRRAIGLASEIAQRLGSGNASYYASQALVAFGEPALPALVDVARGERRIAAGAAIRTLALSPSGQAEQAMLELLDDADVGARVVLSREAAARAARGASSAALALRAATLVDDEVRTLAVISSALVTGDLEAGVLAELDQRQLLARRRLLCWLAICSRPKEVLELMPLIVCGPRQQADSTRRAAALELLESLLEKQQRSALGALEDSSKKSAGPALAELDDPWLRWFINAAQQKTEEDGSMNVAQKVMLLRKVDLFSELSGEILVTIAEVCEAREFTEGEQIFKEADAPDGLYVISAGSVAIKRGEKTLVRLGPSEFFGEVALLDDAPRMADAVASGDGMVLFMDRDVFRQIADDLPDVLRAIIRTLIQYLKHTEATVGTQTMF